MSDPQEEIKGTPISMFRVGEHGAELVFFQNGQTRLYIDEAAKEDGSIVFITQSKIITP